MPKQKRDSHQPSFLPKRDIPQMSEGYYSSGPNPNLAKFVEEHATPYDPETDDYDVPPFDQPITTTKATAIYNMHTYWSKKPHDAIQQYIRHYTKPGDLVLDPFCGSGGTALAALMEGRAAIAIDLSPAATFITKNYCTPVDVDELQRAFEELKAKVKPEMDWLYETRCDRCDGRSTTAYTVYSYVFECSKCGTHSPLFDCPETTVAGRDGSPKTISVCPACHSRKAGNPEEYEISTRTSKRLNQVPVMVSYLCEEGCKPKRGERLHNDPDPKKRAYFEKYDLGKLKEIEKKPIPYWYPSQRMLNQINDNEKWGLLWRPYLKGINKVNDFFTSRNLYALSLLNNYVEADSPLKFVFTSLVINASKMQQVRFDEDGSIRESSADFAKGTYYIPPFYKEINCFSSYVRRLENIVKGYMFIEWRSKDLLISTQSSIDLTSAFSESIDYIFTDPPYSWKVQYGEANYLWEAWLKFDSTWLDNEIIVNEFRGKGEQYWTDLIRQSFSECLRVLKPGRWISICYHDTSEGTWSLLQDVMAEIGFIVDSVEQPLFFETGQKAWKQIVAEKVTKRDLVINFRKPRVGELAEKVVLTGDEDSTSFFEKARSILIESLEAHPGSTADRLYDELVSRMVRKGDFQRHNFDEVLRSVAEPVSEPVMRNLFEPASPDLFGSHEMVRWYLLDTAGHVDDAEGKKEAAAAARLGAFMQEFLASPKGRIAGVEGIHYSDLFEQYLPIHDKPRRLLQDWLPEYFFKTSEGTWRPANDEDERQQKLGLRSTGVLRRIKRFANALIEVVPPGERDKPVNPATLADWIYQCRRAGLYDLGRILYEKGGLRFDGLSEELQLQVEEDYQICVRRGKQNSKPTKNRNS